MKRIILTASILTALSLPALAADPLVEIPHQVSPIFSWTGAYIGVQAGYGWGDADHSFSNGAPGGNSDPDGFLGGMHIGYNYQIDQIVIGAEADIDYSDVNGSYTNLAGATSAGSADINWQSSLRARLGYSMDRTLIYATGGVAFARVDYDGGPAGGPFGGYSDTRTGWTVGAGVEHAFTDNITARLEYRYTDFGAVTGELAPAFPGVNMRTDLNTHAVRVGLSYKF